MKKITTTQIYILRKYLPSCEIFVYWSCCWYYLLGTGGLKRFSAYYATPYILKSWDADELRQTLIENPNHFLNHFYYKWNFIHICLIFNKPLKTKKNTRRYSYNNTHKYTCTHKTQKKMRTADRSRTEEEEHFKDIFYGQSKIKYSIFSVSSRILTGLKNIRGFKFISITTSPSEERWVSRCRGYSTRAFTVFDWKYHPTFAVRTKV